MGKLICTPKEAMAVSASRLIKNGDTVIVGTGLPLVASILAKHTHAQDAILIMEAGPYDGNPLALPSCVADPRGFYRSPLICDPVQLMGQFLQNGRIKVGFLGGAQVDKYGNVNSTCIGDYRNPHVRFEGSGGASDIAALAHRFYIIISHEARRLVERVDYLTSPGWYCYRNPPSRELVRREELGMRGGPEAVVTTMGVMKFDQETKEMFVAEYYEHMGVTLDVLKENTGFEIDVSRAIPASSPTEEELHILRTMVDPEGIYMN
ncbi:CoA-transferase subunit beta [Desulfotomaculum copahuensis]|uniref:CoA-transferase subunit beta n=1 Tax=Desulfotomaculum copahuensis TaxID=1838280 RepID=UPI001373337D|nr:CoA-transferase [Desulfotomaculum copahuensis]